LYPKALRFQDPAPWSKKYIGTRKATEKGATCLSNSQKTGSEDCLFLNIYTPLDATPASKLPVLLFIHGGSFVEGSGNDYDCSILAKQHNAVYITINYRLGSFGWLHLGDGNANFGLKDQRQAMKFTRDEIYAFGGDPDRVMIFGESAGAISVQDQVVTKKSAGLFTAALSESGMVSAAPTAFAENNTATYLKAANCGKGSAVSILSCLQSKPTTELLAASEKTSGTGDPFIVPGWGPTVDNDEFTSDPYIMLQSGDFNRNVTVIAGSNTDEGVLFTPAKPLNNEEYEKFIREVLFGHGRPYNQTQFDMVLKQYPEGSAIKNHKTAAQLAGDITFICGARDIVQMASTYGKGGYLYHFDIPTAGVVLHASEIPFVFDDAAVQKDQAKQKVAEALGDLWYSFAQGSGPGENWPAYKNTTDLNIVIRSPMDGAKFATETAHRKEYCDFWFNLFYGSQ
jgi:carboxylesterase type B